MPLLHINVHEGKITKTKRCWSYTLPPKLECFNCDQMHRVAEDNTYEEREEQNHKLELDQRESKLEWRSQQYEKQIVNLMDRLSGQAVTHAEELREQEAKHLIKLNKDDHTFSEYTSPSPSKSSF